MNQIQNDILKPVSGFLLTKALKDKLSTLSSAANVDGQRTVRWTDLLEYGVSKLTPEDLVVLHRSRTESLGSKPNFQRVKF